VTRSLREIAYTNRSPIGNSSRDVNRERVVVRGLPPAAPAPRPLPPGSGKGEAATPARR